MNTPSRARKNWGTGFSAPASPRTPHERETPAQTVMRNIHELCTADAAQYGLPGADVLGANTGGFMIWPTLRRAKSEHFSPLGRIAPVETAGKLTPISTIL